MVTAALFLAGVAEAARFIYIPAIAFFSIRVRISVQPRRPSLLAATASLLGFRNSLPACGTAADIWPFSTSSASLPEPPVKFSLLSGNFREFATLLAFAAMRRQ
jgi:hypothetical protein